MATEPPQHDRSPGIAWDDKGCPFSTTFGDVYFSKAGGVDESRHVFIEGNALPRRFAGLPANSAFTIGETGFGTGLNFLVAWQCWQRQRRDATAQLHFLSLEKFPLARRDLDRALALWPALAQYRRALIAAYPPQPASGFHRLKFARGKIVLTLYFGDAAEGLEQLAAIGEAGPIVQATSCSLGAASAGVDAWFLDGFAPAKNPHMWSARLLRALTAISAPSASFATFTAAGAVRRSLTECGFVCEKIAGFGRKREMLIGQRDDKPVTQPHIPRSPTADVRQVSSRERRVEPSWHLVENASLGSVNHCLVIGGGLAGCHTALALAEKNIEVTLLERHGQLARETSGNRQGVVYAKLSPHSDPLSRFNLAALIYANHIYQSYSLYQHCGEQCGVLHLATNDGQEDRYRQLADQFWQEESFAEWAPPRRCREISGVSSRLPALYLPKAGWLSPPALCHRLVQHENITPKVNSEVAHLKFEDHQWIALDAKRHPLASADAVVIAAAAEALWLPQCRHLPLKKVRGQITHIAAQAALENLRTVLCGDGYVAPPFEAECCIGATFTLNNDASAPLPVDHAENIAKLRQLSPDFANLAVNPNNANGRVGFRCTTPDYLPIVGPLAVAEPLRQTFSVFKKKANAVVDAPGVYYPHLYCNLGHGSRGLCYTPLCAEILASIISGQFAPISRELYRYLHPARFMIRDLMRNKI